MKYNVIIYGGGTAGAAAAYTAAKSGLKTLLIEKTDTLGGAASRGLVSPAMKVYTGGINTDFIIDLKIFADKYSCRHKFIDGNEFWLNPELLKIVLDDMLKSAGCSVLFSSAPKNINYNSSKKIFENTIGHRFQDISADSDFLIDATADGCIFKLLNCSFQEHGNKFQAPSLRFIMSGINMSAFADWLEEFDKDRTVTAIERTPEQIYLSTACTWDTGRSWALRPLFEKALRDKVLEYEDTAYFQVFSIPSMPDSLNFNAPRIILKDGENFFDAFTYSKAVMQARERIFRLSQFCRKYLKGFENAYISHISDMTGIRESKRVKGRYTVTSSSIINPVKFNDTALACDYPIDIHSVKKSGDALKYVKKPYYIPVEALISKDYERLYGIGRIISADFEAQAALRTQISCFSMGEAAAKDIYKKINER